MQELKTLYLFDFDGTITKKDTLFHFLKFYTGTFNYFFGLIIFSPVLLLAKINLLNKAKVKEKFVSFFLKNQTESKIKEVANLYASQVENIFRTQAIELLLKLKNDSLSDCYLVSASLDLWLQPIAKKYNFNLICTKTLLVNGIYSGKFKSLNCNFKEKKKRILEEINLSKYHKIIAFGDSKGDLDMFSIANKTYFKPFR